jgi:hypothetical protein
MLEYSPSYKGGGFLFDIFINYENNNNRTTI